jgi:hypothetical protein
MGEAKRRREAAGFHTSEEWARGRERRRTLSLPEALARYPYRTLLCRTPATGPTPPLFSPVPLPDDLPEPAMIVTIAPPARDLDADTRALVLALVERGETVLLVSEHAELRDAVKRSLALGLAKPEGTA